MPYVVIVTVLALVQFIWFGIQVAQARAKFGIPAPAITGHAVFERYFRVHMNTLEQIVVFLPAMWAFATFVSPVWAAGFGVVYVVGRFIYAAAYVREPKSRQLGFALTVLPSFIMMITLLVWAVRALI